MVPHRRLLSPLRRPSRPRLRRRPATHRPPLLHELRRHAIPKNRLKFINSDAPHLAFEMWDSRTSRLAAPQFVFPVSGVSPQNNRNIANFCGRISTALRFFQSIGPSGRPKTFATPWKQSEQETDHVQPAPHPHFARRPGSASVFAAPLSISQAPRRSATPSQVSRLAPAHPSLPSTRTLQLRRLRSPYSSRQP